MDFRTVSLALRPYISDVYNLTDAADAVVSLGTPAPVRAAVTDIPHKNLVLIAQAVPSIMAALKNSQKIVAIKELRTLTGCSLRAAKDAIEDKEVENAVTLDRLRDKLSATQPPPF